MEITRDELFRLGFISLEKSENGNETFALDEGTLFASPLQIERREGVWYLIGIMPNQKIDSLETIIGVFQSFGRHLDSSV